MINVAIIGYGNLGRGVELALKQNPDFRLMAIFTRRNPETVTPLTPGVRAEALSKLSDYKGKLDLVFLCGGSATDLPVLAPEILADFNIVDSFDTHNKIPDYLAKLDGIGRAAGTLALISAGWDPGLFSLMRLYFSAFLPEGATHTFWGKGVSQGHSDAVRRIDGVKYAVQYTVPKAAALSRAREGAAALATREKHLRQCFVVAEPAEHARIRESIANMPDYFKDYDTEVNFISEAEFLEKHTALPHGGLVLRTGASAAANTSALELNIALESNPEFTGSILVAYARALHALRAEGRTGAVTVYDVPPAYLLPDRAAAIKNML